MTLTFWLIASTMIVVVLGFLLWPLLKRAPGVREEQERTLPIYRQQFTELEQDRVNGLLSEDQYQLSRQELERRVLEEADTMTPAVAMAPRQLSARLVALVLSVAVPTASVVLYGTLGNPLAMTHPTASPLTAQGNSGEDREMAEGLNELVQRLRQKLEQDPGDPIGWALLARSYVAMERHAEAVPIFEKAVNLNPDDAQLLADYADALGFHQGRKLEGKPDTLIQKALKIDPRNVKALMLSGTVAFNRQNYARAAKEWEEARANLPADMDPGVSEQLTAGITEAQRRGRGGQPVMTAKGTPATPVAQAKEAGSADASRAITGTVVLGAGLASQAAPTDTLFVFARDPKGPPMPVAIVRAARKDLPFTFRLDDSTSPMPSRKLSSMDKVVIVARLSKSGQAMPQPGDLEGMSEPVTPGANGLTVVIDQTRP